MNDMIKYESVNEIIKEIEEAFYDIPFGNSQFQTEKFVIGGERTPERAYRAIGLAMSSKLQALKEEYYKRKKEDIDIEELEYKIKKTKNKFDKKRYAIKIEQKLSNRKSTDKLINDALAELNILYNAFKELPKYTREEFEKGEYKYFEQKLSRQVLVPNDSINSLELIGVNLESIPTLIEHCNDWIYKLNKPSGEK
jgi:hypothetical protein